MTGFEMNEVNNFTEDSTSAGDTVTTVKTAPSDEDGGDITYSISDTTNYAINETTGEVTLTEAGANLVNSGQELPAFNVTATSAGVDGSSQTVQNLDPAVTTVNDAMTGFEMNEVNNFTEDSTSAGDTVTTVKTAPSDEDGGDITYSISDTTNYAINETTGEVTLTEAGANLVNSGQELPAFNVTATSAGVDGSSQTVQNLDPAVTTVNDAMTGFEMNEVNNFTEDSTSAGDTVTTVKTAPSDEDGGDITYSISDTTNYAINETTGEVTLTEAGANLVNSGQELPAFNVTATSAGVDGSSQTVQNLDPAVTTVNDAMTGFEMNEVNNFTEDSTSAGDTVTTVKTAPSDEDGGDITYSISDTTNYAINETTGEVTLTEAGANLVNSGQELPAFNVTATSAGVDGSSQTVQNLDPAVTTVNDAMTGFEMNEVNNFTEDSTSAGDTVTTVKTAPSDEDGGDITYSISDTTNYAINETTGEVTLTEAGANLVNSGQELPAFNVTATSAGVDGSSQTVQNLDPAVTTVNDAMTGFEMNEVNNFTEDSTSAGDTVTTVKTAPSDEDGGDITYSISDTTNYAINETTGEVTLTEAGANLVNSGQELPAFNVTATSAGVDGSSQTVQNLDPAVTTVNDAMTGFEMNEVNNFTEDSTSAGDTVTTVKTAPSDEDGGDITYSISDTTNYAINETTGEVTLTEAGANLVNSGQELPAFNVTATSAGVDGSSQTVQNLDPAVTTVNDAMTGFEMNEVNNFTEDSTSAGDTVTTVKTAPSDEDGGDITYSISDTTNYAINETTGEVTLTEAGANLVNSGQELPAFNVTATSAGVDGSSQTVQNLDPAVTTVNDAMTGFEMNEVNNFTEDSTSAGDTVTTVKTAPSDEDGGDITYSISDTTNYAINETTGEVTLTEAGANLVNSGQELPAFNVTATSAGVDGSSQTVQNLDPAVTTVNDAMTGFEMNEVNNFTEDSTSAGDTVTTVKTAPSDEDGGDITYSISDTTNYAINETTGEVTLTEAGANLVNSGQELPAFNVTATSAGVDGSSQTVQNLDPAVTTVNDAMTGFEMNEVNNFTEDSTSAGDTVTTVKTAPSDEDGGDITYSISDTTNYAINETTGEVTLTEAGANLVNSGQELPAFNVTATSAGVDGSSQTVQNLDPAVTTVNDAMTGFEMNEVNNFTEDSTSAGDTVTTVKTAPSDEDGGDITYSISDTTNYAINETTGEVTLTEAGANLVNSGQELPAFNVTATSAGVDGSSQTVQNLDPAVTTVNDAMTGFEMNEVNNFTEDSTSAGDTVTTVKTAPSDEDGGDITYSISDTTNYAINETTGEVTLTEAGANLVNSGQELPAFNVTATSAGVDGSSQTVQNLDPAVTTVNDAMTGFEMNEVNNFTEDSTSAGDTVTTVKTAPSDEDGGDITYSISDTTNYAINETTGEVTLTEAGANLVNSGQELPAFNVTATSAGVDGSSQTVQNLDPAVTTVNDAMTGFEMNEVNNFTEDSTSAGDTVTTVKTAPSDEDGGDITYSISDTTNYAINETTGEVTLTEAGANLVNSGQELPAFNVTATSAGVDGSSQTVQNLDPAVTTVNDAMTGFEMNEVNNFTEDSTSAGDTVTTVKTAPSDEDGGDITYSISDTTNYAINETTGEVTLTEAGANLVNSGQELPAFNVTATSAGVDGSSQTVQNLDPAVTTVNDAMTGFEMNEVNNFTEDSTSAGDTVTTVKTAPSDEDGGDITYSISDTTNYAINETTGEVTLTEAGANLVNSGQELPAFNVTATSAGVDGSSQTVQNLDPAVTTVNDAMTGFEMNEVNNFTEDSTSAGDTVTTVKTAPSDEDGGDITYSISDTTNYAINETTGEVTLTEAGANLVNSGQELPAFNVTATSAGVDGSSQTVQNLDPAVTTVNDAMTGFEMNEVNNFTEDSTSAGDTVTTVKTAPSDEDGGDITYSISDTTNYAINETTGEVTLTEAGVAVN